MYVVPPSDKSYIDELKKSLYSRSVPSVQTRRKVRFDGGNEEVKTDWEHPPEEEKKPVVLNTEYKNKSMSFFTKLFFFIFGLIFRVSRQQLISQINQLPTASRIQVNSSAVDWELT
jgi:hypothetical protein